MKSLSDLAGMRFAPAPAICACCFAPAGPVGYRPRRGDPYIWFCDNPACFAKRERVYRMPANVVTDLLEKALATGGQAGGRFLDSIEQTDLGELTEAQYLRFCKIVFTTTADEMRRLMTGEQ